jgi:hypothetical protein
MQLTRHFKPSQLLVLLSLVSVLLLTLAGCGGGIQYTGIGTPTSSFDPKPTAYSEAQQAESYRRTNPSGRNYCVLAILTENSKGSVTAGPRQLFFGFGKDSNTNHCEQRALAWAAGTGLPSVFGSVQLSKVAFFHLVLFTQVRACSPCVKSFPSWNQQLQKQVAAQPGGSSVQVKLYVWQITPGSPSGFDPGVYKAGPYGPPVPGTVKPVPVRRQDINQVYP